MLERFQRISAFVFDVDGVLTDATVALPGNSHQERTMNIKDGYALQLAIKKGYLVLVISGGDSQEVVHRLNKLGIKEIHLRVTDKMAIINDFCLAHSLQAKEILFMGDDIPDLSAMEFAGMACAPHDAIPEVRHYARYISRFGGGKGCVRDVIEKVLKLNGHWDNNTHIASK